MALKVRKIFCLAGQLLAFLRGGISFDTRVRTSRRLLINILSSSHSKKTDEARPRDSTRELFIFSRHSSEQWIQAKQKKKKSWSRQQSEPISFQQTTRRHIPDDRTLHKHCYENLQSYNYNNSFHNFELVQFCILKQNQWVVPLRCEVTCQNVSLSLHTDVSPPPRQGQQGHRLPWFWFKLTACLSVLYDVYM
jgi:hypothetical protein